VSARADWTAHKPGQDVARGARAARTSDTPPGFWYGTDSQYVNVSGPPPYKTPVIGGAYGGYIGMLGKWSYFLRCRVSPPTWSKINSAQANLNFQKYDKGVGTAGYWFMGGPGVDPRYNGTVEEANNWGTRQAARALSNMRGVARRPAAHLPHHVHGHRVSGKRTGFGQRLEHRLYIPL